jgi:hypothetical protein
MPPNGARWPFIRRDVFRSSIAVSLEVPNRIFGRRPFLALLLLQHLLMHRVEKRLEPLDDVGMLGGNVVLFAPIVL